MIRKCLFENKKLNYFYLIFCFVIFIFGLVNYILFFIFEYRYDFFYPNFFTFIFSLFSLLSGIIFLFVIYRLGKYYQNLYDIFDYKNQQSYLEEQFVFQESFQLIEKQYFQNIYYQLNLLDQSQTNEFEQDIVFLENAIQRYKNTYSQNMIIDSLLLYKFHAPQYQHIQINTDIHVPVKSFVSDIDLSSLLFNLVDNALNGACQSSEPEIFLSIEEKYHCLKIQIQNSYVSNQIVSSDKYHGYGLKIIKDIVKRYHGEIYIKKQDKFEVIAYLYEEGR